MSDATVSIFPSSRLAARVVSLAADLVAAVATLRGGTKGIFVPAYRPELHYMRGPGPKWREAHARVRHR